MAKTLKNCVTIKRYGFLGIKKPIQTESKCEGFGYLYPDNTDSACVKCNLLIKDKSK